MDSIFFIFFKKNETKLETHEKSRNQKWTLEANFCPAGKKLNKIGKQLETIEKSRNKVDKIGKQLEKSWKKLGKNWRPAGGIWVGNTWFVPRRLGKGWVRAPHLPEWAAAIPISALLNCSSERGRECLWDSSNAHWPRIPLLRKLKAFLTLFIRSLKQC